MCSRVAAVVLSVTGTVEVGTADRFTSSKPIKKLTLTSCYPSISAECMDQRFSVQVLPFQFFFPFSLCNRIDCKGK